MSNGHNVDSFAQWSGEVVCDLPNNTSFVVSFQTSIQSCPRNGVQNTNPEATVSTDGRTTKTCVKMAAGGTSASKQANPNPLENKAADACSFHGDDSNEVNVAREIAQSKTPGNSGDIDMSEERNSPTAKQDRNRSSCILLSYEFQCKYFDGSPNQGMLSEAMAGKHDDQASVFQKNEADVTESNNQSTKSAVDITLRNVKTSNCLTRKLSVLERGGAAACWAKTK